MVAGVALGAYYLFTRSPDAEVDSRMAAETLEIDGVSTPAFHLLLWL